MGNIIVTIFGKLSLIYKKRIYSMADTKSMKEYGFLEPGWRKKKKESRIFPDFKSRWEKKNNHKRKS